MSARLGWEVLRMALSALARSRMRTFLSVLGVVIGVAAFVTMTAVGTGASQLVNSRISSLGTNLLVVTPGSTGFAALFRGSAVQASTLTYRDALALGDHELAPAVSAVAPVISRSEELAYGGNSWSAQVAGTSPQLLGIRDLTVAQGRFLEPRDMNAGAPVIVLGAQVAQALFPGPGSPLGKFVDVGPVPFRVVGVLASVGAQGAQSQDNTAYVPITTAFLTLFPADTGQNLPQILLSARSQADLARAAGEVTAVLMALHHLAYPQQQPDFTVTSQTQFLAAAQSIATTLSLLLAASAAIALLVGGIGIMNIMTVSVAERTREIGIRKAVGATPAAILLQFFLEAVLISVGGGIVGLGGGIAAALMIPHVIHGLGAVVSLGALELGLAVSLGVGVVFGYYPARRAMGLDPIDALAHE